MKQKIYHRKSLFFVKKDAILYLGLLVFLDITLTYGNISSHISKCCTAGTNYAKRLGHCNDHINGVTEIPPLWHGLCLSALGLCCSREEENLHCKAGREAANMGSKCTGDGKYNTSAYTSCCKSCQIGLAVSAAGNNCSDAITDFFAKDESFTICCNHAHSIAVAETKLVTDEEGTVVLANDEDICETFGVGKLCEHICENTKSSYVCKCQKGYQLNENGVTCSKIPTSGDEPTEEPTEETDDEDDDFSEEYGQETLSECQTGFEKDKITGKCKDIDECSKGQTSCLDHEYCSNTPGSYKCFFVKTTHCQRGYRFNTNTEECDDINECLEETHDCKNADETCFNTRGSYSCKDKFLKKCQDGFIFSAETGKCEDYGHTDDNLGRTGINGKLEKCSSGFRLKHGQCIDINECETDKNACDKNQNCKNDVGGYRCECKDGFNMDTVTNACVDINECVINNHKCLPTQRCDNSIGSYTCIRLQSCGTGYTLNSETETCEDDDECKLRIHTCSAGYECRNTKGSFRCDRKRTTTTTTTTTPVPITVTSKINSALGYPTSRGNYPSYASSATNSQLQRPVPNYRLKPPYSSGSESPCGIGFHRNHVGACVDVDECQTSSVCGTHQRCVNTNGSYRCENLLKCRGGFKSSPDGIACVDIDECTTGKHNCVNNQNCINRSGSFICTCPSGHKLDLNNRCVDINECEQKKPSVCSITSTCMNTIGSFYCECKNGYKKQHANCIDVDECQEIPGLCQQECLNFWGGYRCSCNPGYELDGDNRTCIDIDECEVHKTYGLCMGICLNVPGSYVCSCPRGYKLSEDNRSCVDINECATGNFCTGRNDVCTNTQGSFRCTTIRCPYGYVNDADKNHRCRLANICEGDECFSKPAFYTYNFITLVSKLPILLEGRKLFTLRGPDWFDNIDFDLKIVRTHAAANIEKATEHHFSTIKRDHQVELSLIRELEGPQDVELELSMNVFMKGQLQGKSVSKIFIIVSQYSF